MSSHGYTFNNITGYWHMPNGQRTTNWPSELFLELCTNCEYNFGKHSGGHPNKCPLPNGQFNPEEIKDPTLAFQWAGNRPIWFILESESAEGDTPRDESSPTAPERRASSDDDPR